MQKNTGVIQKLPYFIGEIKQLENDYFIVTTVLFATDASNS